MSVGVLKIIEGFVDQLKPPIKQRTGCVVGVDVTKVERGGGWVQEMAGRFIRVERVKEIVERVKEIVEEVEEVEEVLDGWKRWRRCERDHRKLESMIVRTRHEIKI